MTQDLVSRRFETPKTVVLASALLLGVASPCYAGDIGSFLGGVVGGIIGQSPQPQPQPQYYQQQPYQQQPYQQQQSAEAHRQYLARQAELKRQKAEQQKAKKDQEEAAALAQPVPDAAPAVPTPSGPLEVAMKRNDGNLWVPAQINNVVTIDFVIDSGASDITLPRDVYLTLIRSGTLTKANYIGTAQFGIADGSEVKGAKFKLASLQVGNQVLTDVVASVMPSDSATPLLGLSFLSRFQSWSIDNSSGTLKLIPLPGGSTTASTQVAAATPQPQQQPVVDSAAVAPTAPATPAAGQALPPELLASSADAPRSGRAASSALIVKEGPATTTPAVETAPVSAPTAKAETSSVPVFPTSTAYADARRTLIALGYGPAPLSDSKCDTNTDSTCFPERDACTKADGIQCDFFWRRGDQVIKVNTAALPPVVSSIECQVNCK
jgi:clan AA aspartic protease (TIGR02281 family)